MKSLKSLGKFSLWQKFLCLGVCWLAVVSLPTSFYIKENNRDNALSRLERQGLTPAQLMLDIIQRTQQHASLTARFLQESTVDNNSAAKKERRAKAEELEEAIVDLEDYAGKVKNKNIASGLEKITADWHQISQRVTVREISLTESLELHKALVQKQLDALQMLLDGFQLSRDPEAAGAYLIGSTLVATPEMVETLAQLRVMGATLLTQGEASYGDRVELRSLLLLSQARAREVDAGIAKFSVSNPAMKESVQQNFAKVHASYQGLLDVTQEEILGKASFSLSADDYRNKFTQAVDDYYNFMRFSITQVDELLKQRIDARQTVLTKLVSTIIFVSALMLLIYMWFVKKFLRQLGAEPAYISNALQLMIHGDLKQNIAVKQPGSVVAQVKRLQEKLRQEARTND